MSPNITTIKISPNNNNHNKNYPQQQNYYWPIFQPFKHQKKKDQSNLFLLLKKKPFLFVERERERECVCVSLLKSTTSPEEALAVSHCRILAFNLPSPHSSQITLTSIAQSSRFSKATTTGLHRISFFPSRLVVSAIAANRQQYSLS